VGYRLPHAFWVDRYYITDYSFYGVDAPPPNFQWVRYGPDLLLVDLNSGQVANAVYGVFEESDDVPDVDVQADVADDGSQGDDPQQ
jgi:hypothetical protein